MQPPKEAERIIADVCARVRVDEGRLRREIGDRFVPGEHWHDLMEAERIAGEILADAWGDIAADCEQALADVRELYLVQAARVLEAHDDLRTNGSDAWIARGVIHHHAFDLAWDVLDENDLLTELPD